MLGNGPLEPLLRDETVTDIMVNGPTQVFVERNGILELTDIAFRDDAHVLAVASRIITAAGRRIDESNPICLTPVFPMATVSRSSPRRALFTVRLFPSVNSPSAKSRSISMVEHSNISACIAPTTGNLRRYSPEHTDYRRYRRRKNDYA